ncbi:MAG: glucose-6-phosphate isomerase [Bacteroidales bacterium]|nr:glucose-6-phosphate isomerase [Bacteroidales bacterium]MBR6161883.1 glucose-6-phosphate isomerase [Bacteroidales bacterium]
MKISLQDALFAVSEAELKAQAPAAEAAYLETVNKTGRGNDFLGWVNLPQEVSESEVMEIESVAARLAAKSQVVVVIGIGGSYLGARAVIEALQHSFSPMLPNEKPQIVYAGNNMSEDYLHDLLDVLAVKDYSLVVISKSGTTTEPAIAFRILKQHCEQKYGVEEARRRIVAITDKARGALKTLADQSGYPTFVIPDDVGGRYSVLTPVGLLPIAAAGFSIRKLLDGARAMRQQLMEAKSFDTNPAMQYAALRNVLYNKNLKVELMTSFEPRFFYLIEWFKQLFGESEGKELKGIFPAGAIFSTDLHSLGQYIQDGSRQLFETVLTVENAHHTVPIPFDEQNTDGLNYLQHRSINEINHIAQQGTCQAHVDGKVPNIRITIPEINEFYLGELIYFFEMSCAVSGYMLGVNPFDQPGVEAYKRNMFTLLGKPGYSK